MKKLCSLCQERPPRKGQRYCRPCHAVYMVLNRPKYKDLSAKEKKRIRCRAKANVYKKRGKLIPEPCHFCDSTLHLNMHHDDYSKPLKVTWLCRACHVALHAGRIITPEFRRMVQKRIAITDKKLEEKNVGNNS